MSSNTPAEDVAPFEFLAAVHKLSEDLALAGSPEDQIMALREHIRFTSIHLNVPQEEIQCLWDAMKDAGLIAKLFAIVARNDLDPDDGVMTIAHGSAVLYLYYIAFTSSFAAFWKEDQAVQALVGVHAPRFCTNTISVHSKTYDEPEDAKMVYLAFRLFGHWIHARLSNQKFIESLDAKSILRFVYNIQFDLRSYFPGGSGDQPGLTIDPNVTENDTMITTRHCATLMEVLSMTDPAIWLPCTQEAVQRYGAENVVTRCKALFADDAIRLGYMYISRTLSLYLISTLHIYYPIHQTFSRQDVYAAMLDQYWRIYSKTAPNLPPRFIHEDLAVRTLLFLQTTLLHVDRGSDVDVRLVCDGLLKRQDLILLWGTVLVRHLHPSDYRKSDVNLVMENLKTLLVGCFQHRNLRTDPLLINQALHVYRCLNATEPHVKEGSPRPAEASLHIAYWESVIQESFLRSHRQLCGKHSTNLVGCSYVACPLFRDNVVAGKRMMLLCSRCRSVQYCNVGCQRSDWLYSGHEDVCTL